MPDFECKLKQYRQIKGLTQEQLAEKLDMSINYVGKLERGVIIPSALVIFKLSKILRTDMNELFKEIT